MNRLMRSSPVCAVAVAVIALVATAPASWAQEELDEAKVIIEINATDGDAGFQAMGDATGWNKLSIHNPDGKKIFDVKARKSLKEQGLTEIFFESEEPSCEAVPLDTFLGRFPSGDYAFKAKTNDKTKLMSEATLTHELPAAPEILSPAEAVVLDASSPVVITWGEGEDLGECAVPGVEPSAGELFGYQVVVEREDPGPLVVFSVDLSSAATQVTLPPEFVEDDTIYKFEVIAIEARGDEGEEEDVERGNQTISESFFCTLPIDPLDCVLD